MVRYLLFFICMTLLGCNSNEGGDTPANPVPGGSPNEIGDGGNNLATWSFDANLVSGSHSDTEENSGVIQLTTSGQSNGSGTYESEIFDSQVGGLWNQMSVTLSNPAGQNLADDRVAENTFDSGNVNMQDNVLLLHLDETSLTGATDEIKDSSGLAHHASRTGSTVSSTDGQLGKGIALDGAGEHIQVPDHPDLDFTTSLTMAGWFFFNNDIGNKRLIVKGLQVSNHWAYRIVTLDGGAFGFQDGLLVQLSANGTKVMVQTFLNNALQNHKDKWVHIAATYDGGTLKLFVNGDVIAQKNHTGTIFNSPGALGIGAAINGTFAIDGAVDEVALFSQALSDTDIRNIFERGAHRVQMQVKACPDENCAGGIYSSSLDLNRSSKVTTFNLSSLSQVGRFFQTKLIYSTIAGAGTPKTSKITVSGHEFQNFP